MPDPVPNDPRTPDLTYSSRPPGDSPAPSAKRSGSARTWIIVAVVAVVVVVGAVVAVAAVADSAAIHDGPGTATFTWTPVHQPSTSDTTKPQPFTASINGHSVTGTATTILPASASSLLGGDASQPVPAFRYTGQFAGQPFSLVVSFNFSGVTAATASTADLKITVAGHYGDMPVAGVITAPAAGPSSNAPAHLTGNIGHWKITADIPAPTGNSTSQSATVHYVVSG